MTFLSRGEPRTPPPNANDTATSGWAREEEAVRVIQREIKIEYRIGHGPSDREANASQLVDFIAGGLESATPLA
jgi:hypothetical protein